MESTGLLEKLCQIDAVAGDESPIAYLIEGMLEEIGPTVRTPLGSLICRVTQADPSRPHVVLEAHMDEIGLMVSRIDEKGFLKVGRCGGIDRRVALACAVKILGKNGVTYPGILASEQEDQSKNPTLDELYVDVGMDKQQAEACFPVGTRISYVGRFRHLLGGKVCSKALDDRCGCSAVIQAARMLKETSPNCSVSLLISSMEEVGGMGAATGAYALQPISHCISVDVSFGITPELKEQQGGKLGDGPMIGHNPILSRAMSEELTEVAVVQGIRHQVKVYAGYRTGTDADGIILAGCGANGACVCIALRNMHTPVEVISAEDVENTACLIARYVAERLGGGGEN